MPPPGVPDKASSGRIEAASGRLLSRTPIYSPDPATGRQPAQYNANSLPGARADLLSSDAGHVYLRDLVFDPAGAPMKEGNTHLFAVTGFLDDAWAHRSYWIFGQRCSLATGCSGRAKDLLYGRLLVFDESRVCGYGRRSVHWSNSLEDGPYEVFARDRVTGRPLWARGLPVRVRGMMLAGNLLFVAGASGSEGEASREPTPELPAQVVTLSVADGTEQARCTLSSAPGFDGLAAAYGRLYLTTTAGRLVCLAGTGPREGNPAVTGLTVRFQPCGSGTPAGRDTGGTGADVTAPCFPQGPRGPCPAGPPSGRVSG